MTLTVLEALVAEQCCVCSIRFAMPENFKQHKLDHRDETGGWECNRFIPGRGEFYCPNGHVQHYLGQTEAQRWQWKAEEAQRLLANREDDLRVERAAHAQTKGKLTRTSKRVVAGVCPHCNRHFVNVEHHMATRHGGPGERLTGPKPRAGKSKVS